MLDYKKLGLKSGLEIHQQLDTKTKLFCRCSTDMKEKEPEIIIKRKQHPVASELGEVDIASHFEFLRDRTFNYQTFYNESCEIDADESPPHELNIEALNTALEIALMLNCEIPNEIHIMRKTITDGSNPTAFQRTAVIGMNGFLNYKGKKIEIKYISLEEDASAIVKEEDGTVTYRLNRTGVPLVEISTGLLEGFSPEEIQDIAFQIGMICRSTGKVKRGLGSIRQDVNVSIKVGARTEIKGLQELGMLDTAIEYEIQRQLTLIKLKKELLKKKSRKVSKPANVTNELKGTQNHILRSVLGSNGLIYAIVLPKFAGLLKKEICPGKTLGRELADVAVAFGVKGILHTDEDVVKMQTFEEFKRLRQLFNTKDDDAIILVGELKEKGKVAEKIAERINKLFDGIEQETRGANPDGTTRYNRPLPGSARMYPETDVIPIGVSKEMIDKIKKNLPEPWTKKLAKFKSSYRLSEQLAKEILRSDYLDLFEKIVKAKKGEPSIVASTFTSIIKDLERDGIKVENIDEKHHMEIFDYLGRKRIVKEAIPEILRFLANKPGESVSIAVDSLGLKSITIEELKKIIRDVVSQPNINFDKAVGLVMSKVRGKVDAQIVIKEIKKLIKH